MSIYDPRATPIRHSTKVLTHETCSYIVKDVQYHFYKIFQILFKFVSEFLINWEYGEYSVKMSQSYVYFYKEDML